MPPGSTSFTFEATSMTLLSFSSIMRTECVHFLEGVAEGLGLELYMHDHAIEAGFVIDHDAIMRRRRPRWSESTSSTWLGEHVGAANDEHVVAAAAHLLHARRTCGRTRTFP